ncbi:MAG: hypothetical protein BWK80_00805 [Desulfobacteraceae bacterium IS3]|nr:MAG: hypothetical protein BWK80_00805 [Desulfobacteraceae bacterium IS3]
MRRLAKSFHRSYNHRIEKFSIFFYLIARNCLTDTKTSYNNFMQIKALNPPSEENILNSSDLKSKSIHFSIATGHAIIR